MSVYTSAHSSAPHHPHSGGGPCETAGEDPPQQDAARPAAGPTSVPCRCPCPGKDILTGGTDPDGSVPEVLGASGSEGQRQTGAVGPGGAGGGEPEFNRYRAQFPKMTNMLWVGTVTAAQ